MMRRICQWCGVRLGRWKALLRFHYCSMCNAAMMPPCKKWDRILPEDVELVPRTYRAVIKIPDERT